MGNTSTDKRKFSEREVQAALQVLTAYAAEEGGSVAALLPEPVSEPIVAGEEHQEAISILCQFADEADDAMCEEDDQWIVDRYSPAEWQVILFALRSLAQGMGLAIRDVGHSFADDLTALMDIIRDEEVAA